MANPGLIISACEVLDPATLLPIPQGLSPLSLLPRNLGPLDKLPRGIVRRSSDPFCCCCYVTSVVSDSVRPTRFLHPQDSPGKNTGVGCHFLLQCMHACMHAKSLQLCPTLCDPMDSSPPGSSVHRILQARILEWVAISFSRPLLFIYL